MSAVVEPNESTVVSTSTAVVELLELVANVAPGVSSTKVEAGRVPIDSQLLGNPVPEGRPAARVGDVVSNGLEIELVKISGANVAINNVSVCGDT